MAEWFIAKDGEKHGPFSTAQLKHLAASGKLLSTDKVWREGLEGWAAASMVKGLEFQLPLVSYSQEYDRVEKESNRVPKQASKEMKVEKKNTIRGIIIVALFCVILVLVLILAIRDPDDSRKNKDYREMERRTQVSKELERKEEGLRRKEADIRLAELRRKDAELVRKRDIAIRELRESQKRPRKTYTLPKPAKGMKLFSTKNHPKSKGVDFHISYPDSWESKEAVRPNIVQSFINSSDENWHVTVMIITKKLPAEYPDTKEAAEVLLQRDILKQGIPKEATYIGCQQTKIENLPAGIMEFSMVGERAGLKKRLQMLSLVFIHRSVMVQVQFMISHKTREVSQLELSNKMKAVQVFFCKFVGLS